MHSPRLVWQLGKLSEVKVIEKFVGVEGGYFINAVQDWLLAEGAGVSFTQVQADASDSWHFLQNSCPLAQELPGSTPQMLLTELSWPDIIMTSDLRKKVLS